MTSRFVLVKAGQSARAVERACPTGRELALLIAGRPLWVRRFEHGDDAAFEAEVEAPRAALIQRGWQTATA